MNEYISRVLAQVNSKNPNEPEYNQAVKEVLSTIEPVIDANADFEKIALLERMVEPERIITFRVPWVDDKGEVVVNRG